MGGGGWSGSGEGWCHELKHGGGGQCIGRWGVNTAKTLKILKPRSVSLRIKVNVKIY